jgi:hypothetical protein
LRGNELNDAIIKEFEIKTDIYIMLLFIILTLITFGIGLFFISAEFGFFFIIISASMHYMLLVIICFMHSINLKKIKKAIQLNKYDIKKDSDFTTIAFIGLLFGFVGIIGYVGILLIPSIIWNIIFGILFVNSKPEIDKK